MFRLANTEPDAGEADFPGKSLWSYNEGNHFLRTFGKYFFRWLARQCAVGSRERRAMNRPQAARLGGLGLLSLAIGRQALAGEEISERSLFYEP